MDAEKYNRSIKLLCSTCAGSDFDVEEQEDRPRCISCGRVYTKEELQAENGEIIEAAMAEAKEEIARDLSNEMRNSLRKAFSGSKHIRFR